ncbi:transmembrane protein 161B [Drosophila guanche]|uniref:Blast:Superoxide dismutase n=2 Tax=Drosophila guanche TaxID=7266 RepID=A0A3B0JUT4_DROGU|nr:transmembrane protein 161B [Drosophila guanche]SPP77469.1 blast:Superoxide dismutase [Drosophila guanche]
MAVLGAQLVITLVMVSVIQKLSPHYSFAKWILCRTGLYRYLHPTDDELRTKGGVPKEKPAKGKHKQQNGVSGQFHIPRSIELDLETLPVLEQDVVHLRYFTEYQWLLDFSIYAGIVYVVSELFHFYFPLKQEINLSMVWCLLVIFFALKLLSSLTVLYFQSEESIGERSMVIVACLVYLLIAMIVLIIDERILETGLEDAYTSFNVSASKFLTEQGLPSSGPASKIVVKFFLALSCGVLGSLFTFPGLRMAKMHWDSLKYCRGNRVMQVLLNLSFVLPFILVILWIRPISRDYLTVRVFQGMQQPLLTPHAFETLRLLLVIFVVVMRFALMPVYLQSYLNLAYDKILDLRKEAGRITNVEFKQKISSIFYYLCVVTLQFAAPLILCLYLTLMYKSLGGFSWAGVFSEAVVLQHECAADDVETAVSGGTETAIEEGEFNIMESAQSLQASFSSLKNVFSTEVYKGFLGFATWWSYFTLFATSSLGIVYQSYFNKT